MFNSWEQRWIDVDGGSSALSAPAAIFSGVCIVFGFSGFGLSMKMPVRFTFFTRLRTYGADGTSLLPKSVCNFAHILQHYHDFQSNFAIFPSVVQTYKQLNSFSGWMKLIICQIKYDLSVTIHEISTSWKKNRRWQTWYYFVQVKFAFKGIMLHSFTEARLIYLVNLSWL